MEERRDRSAVEKGQQDGRAIVGVSERDIFQVQIGRQACTDSGVFRDGGRPFQILAPEKEKEQTMDRENKKKALPSITRFTPAAFFWSRRQGFPKVRRELR